MPRIMPMPPTSDLPGGPHRDCAEALRRCCQAAGCPPLRQVSRAIESREDQRESQPGALCQHPGPGGGPGLAIGVRRGAGHVLVTVLFRLTGLARRVGLAGTVGEALHELAAGPDPRARAAQDSRAGRHALTVS